MVAGIALLYIAILTPEILGAKNDPSHELPMLAGVAATLLILMGYFTIINPSAIKDLITSWPF